MLGRAEVAAQYLAHYAEPEARLSTSIGDSYSAALVVPVRGEASSLLRGFADALEQAPGRVLVILVLNATDALAPTLHARNAELLRDLQFRFPAARAIGQSALGTRGALARSANCDLLWLDRVSPGARMPARSGVGTARKIGNDLALALWTRGQIDCSRIASSDADARLPADYFSILVREPAEARRCSAWLWPFVHEAGDDRAIHEATRLYEISLRYYVLGLAAAGSCYAYQSVGSTLCLDAAAYSQVRGFPKREAGEDFYVLDKLSKVAPLYRVNAAPIRIRSRRSDRVPFGTGRRSREIAGELRSGADFALYSPAVFEALSVVLDGLDRFAASADVNALDHALRARPPLLADPIREVLDGLGVFAALRSAATRAPRGPVLRRRIHTWFDALRTLRFVHGLRGRCMPSLPWRTALSSAPFLREPFGSGSDSDAVCRVLALAEAELAPQVGPALL